MQYVQNGLFCQRLTCKMSDYACSPFSRDLRRILRLSLFNINRLSSMTIVIGSIRELKHATFLRHGRQPEVNISHAGTVLSPRFSN